MNLFKKKILLLLLPIFILALVLRFLYYPQNTYFGFDQARDVFAVREILSGNLKIVGPPTANGVLHHGVLYYYIFAPFYFLSGGDPTAASVFLRVLNASGIFLIFLVVVPLFGARAALFAAFLFAVSYEQTQFSLFLNHPALAVISVLIFYLGLSYWIFKKKLRGLYIALFGLGLSIQFEFVETQLLAVFVLFILVFRKTLPKLDFKSIVTSSLMFLLPVSPYLISEIKNSFFTISKLPGLIFNQSDAGSPGASFPFLFIINRYFMDNLAANESVAVIIQLIFLILLVLFINKREYRIQLTFLCLWFFGGLLVYFFTNNDAYFYNTGTSIALIIFSAFLLSYLFSKNKFLTFSILALIFISNIYLITKNNPLGPNQKINPQIGLLLKDEQKVIDFIYQDARGEVFAVNALTMPYNVNTTWSYLFEWYGKKNYGYVPVWGGDAADGFPGNLQVENARSRLPIRRYLIIEPQEGIPSYLAKAFLSGEENYTEVTGEKKIGTLRVLIQKPK